LFKNTRGSAHEYVSRSPLNDPRKLAGTPPPDMLERRIADRRRKPLMNSGQKNPIPVQTARNLLSCRSDTQTKFYHQKIPALSPRKLGYNAANKVKPREAVTAMPSDYRPILDKIKAGDWDAAHRSIQDFSDPLACRIHAFLHRQEGDLDNAAYWYARAKMTPPADNLSEELDRLYQLAQK
jgi:hypothetical protein